VSLLGIHFTLMIGRPAVAVPAPPALAEALTSVSVTQSDTGRSGFQLTFQIGRSGPLDMRDYALVVDPLLQPFSRVVLVVRFNVAPQVLMDGVITNVQLAPSNEPGASTLTVTGEDVSVMMDLQEMPMPWPAMSAHLIVQTILGKPNYSQYLFRPFIAPALYPNPKPPTEGVSVQNMTDLNYINFLAARQGYVFYVEPAGTPNTNYAYWGPPHLPPPYRLPPVQKAISFNVGPETNAASVSLSYNALAPTLVAGVIQDSRLNFSMQVVTSPRGLRIPLAKDAAIIANAPNVRLSLLPATPRQARAATAPGASANPSPRQEEFAEARTTAGLSLVEALARAQATTDASTDNVVTASGELDALQYGDILKARSLVGLRGVGFSYDGNYYVKSVSHEIRKGEYKQRFTLTREGTGSLIPLVRP
jgi:hypothetical protein